MSRTPTYKYEVIKETGGRYPQTICVMFEDGVIIKFKIGPHVSRSRIDALLPILVSKARGKKHKRRKVA